LTENPEVRQKTPAGREKPSGGVLLALAVFISAAAFAPAIRGYYHEDDIDVLVGVASVDSPLMALRWLLTPFNEHLLPLAKLPFLPIYRVFGLEAWPFMVLGILQVVFLMAVLWKLSTRWFETDAARLVLVGLFGTTAIYLDCVVRPLCTGWLTALLFSLLALLGVEWYFEGRRKAGLVLAGVASFVAPLSTLFGAPAGLWAAASSLLGGSKGRGTGLQDRAKPAAAALGGMAGYLVLYVIFARGAYQPEVLGREVFVFQPWEGLALTFRALLTRQWGNLLAFPLGPLVSLLAFGGLIAWRKRYPKRLAVGFVAWSFGNLFYVLAFRAWAGSVTAGWERYQLFSAAGTAALVALAVDAFLRWRAETGRMRWYKREHLLYAVVVLLIVNAGLTAGKMNERVNQLRPIRDFCLGWSRLPELAENAGIEPPLVIPNETVNLYKAPPRSLSYYSIFCWTKEEATEARWVDAAAPWPPGIEALITNSEELAGVRNAIGDRMKR